MSSPACDRGEVEEEHKQLGMVEQQSDHQHWPADRPPVRERVAESYYGVRVKTPGRDTAQPANGGGIVLHTGDAKVTTRFGGSLPPKSTSGAYGRKGQARWHAHTKVLLAPDRLCLSRQLSLFLEPPVSGDDSGMRAPTR